MKASHTPGPWAYSTSHEGWSYAINIHQAEDATYTPDWSDVAFKTCQGERREIQEANARLIAAAPELLEALEEARTGLLWYRDRNPGQSDGSDDEAMERIVAAIAKATQGAL